MKQSVFIILFMILAMAVKSQVVVEGYVFQTDNRGFLNRVAIEILDQNDQQVAEVTTNLDGYFIVELPANQNFYLFASKEMFIDKNVRFDTRGKRNGEKVFLKIELHRSPGYTFEITIAEPREDEAIPVDAIKGALIEVYNNTTKEEVLVLKDHPYPDFQVNLIKGNHYTILIRKAGYLAKRMEAYVDVEGCILCFEGIGEVRPGVADNLTEGNQMGVLLANVELEKVVKGKSFEIKNLYYDYAEWELTNSARSVLDNVLTIFKDNPNLLLELGSHTDCRGLASKNLTLSEKRAQSAVAYLKTYGNISDNNIIARGYGEEKPTNRCRDGVDCSEQEHAKNRRTELTILGTLSNYVLKPLSHIKQEESTEALIRELQNQEQIKIKEGESIEQKLEQQDQNKRIPNDQLEPEQSTNLKNDGNQTKTLNDQTSSEISKEKEVSYLNYQVIIHFGTIPLDKDHEIMQKFPEINEYISPQNYIYYSVGHFPTKENAEDYMMENLIDTYPNAYVSPYYKNKKGKL